MPTRAARPCSVPGCANLAYDRSAQCREHRAAADRRKGHSTKRGYDRRWAANSAQYLRVHPWCAWPGCDRPPTETDHIDGDTGNGDWSNLRGFCGYHHRLRTNRDQPGGALLNND